MSGIILRDAALADAAAVADLHLRSWRDAYRRLASAEAYETLTYEVRRARWVKILTQPQLHHRTFVAEQDGRLLGIGVAAAPSEAAFGARGEVRSLYVDPDAKRMGIGRRLLGEVALQLAQWKYPGVALGVVVGNAPAIAFYEALGARAAGAYVDPGPLWRSENAVLVWDDAQGLANRCLRRAS